MAQSGTSRKRRAWRPGVCALVALSLGIAGCIAQPPERPASDRTASPSVADVAIRVSPPTRRVRITAPTAAPTAAPVRGTSHASVSATWYCNATHPEAPRSRCSRGHPDLSGDDLFAAISPDLAHLRGRSVEVCYRERCVVVVVIDCNCRATNAIDLYADAFARLAPLSRGRITVELVEVVG